MSNTRLIAFVLATFIITACVFAAGARFVCVITSAPWTDDGATVVSVIAIFLGLVASVGVFARGIASE